VVQASSQFRQLRQQVRQQARHFRLLIHWSQRTTLQVTDSRQFRRLIRLFTHGLGLTPDRLWAGAILLALLIWNWQLVAALAVGTTAIALVYIAQQKAQPDQLLIPSLDWQSLWQNPDRPLVVALATGVFATLSSYLSLQVLLGSQSWLAIAILLQGFGTFAILGLLTWQTLGQSASQSPSPVSEQRPGDRAAMLLTDLTDADPLKRLLAVRQITQLCLAAVALPLTPTQLVECYRLLLNRETEASVCNALLEGLQAIGQSVEPQRQLPTREAIPADSIAGGKMAKQELESIELDDSGSYVAIRCDS
jgi:hypothetical protein